jgi:hypothetical protein
MIAVGAEFREPTVAVAVDSRRMPEHVHVHAPHELSEAGHGVSRRERVLEIVAAVMLSLATVGIAWSGYQAAKWSGIQARRYTQASTARSLANQAATLAAQERSQDLLNFNRWLELTTEGNIPLAQLYERRFRPEFRPAFKAWVAGDPLNNPNAVASPLLEPKYVLADSVKADRLERLGDQRFEQGKRATENADNYVFVTVFFAAVLFFAGISLRFAWFPIRLIIMILAGALLMYAATRLVTLPTL